MYFWFIYYYFFFRSSWKWIVRSLMMKWNEMKKKKIKQRPQQQQKKHCNNNKFANSYDNNNNIDFIFRSFVVKFHYMMQFRFLRICLVPSWCLVENSTMNSTHRKYSSNENGSTQYNNHHNEISLILKSVKRNRKIPFSLQSYVWWKNEIYHIQSKCKTELMKIGRPFFFFFF